MRSQSFVSYFLIALGCAALACGGSDISDDPPIGGDGSVIDAPPAIDAPSPPDADPNAPDADTSTPDAMAADAMGTRAEIFCGRYETLCGFDNGNADRYDDLSACLSAFGGFDAGQMTCVEGQLDSFESDRNPVHCARAMGTGPCS